MKQKGTNNTQTYEDVLSNERFVKAPFRQILHQSNEHDKMSNLYTNTTLNLRNVTITTDHWLNWKMYYWNVFQVMNTSTKMKMLFSFTTWKQTKQQPFLIGQYS